MRVHVVPRPDEGAAAASEGSRSIVAIDLSASPEYRALWRPQGPADGPLPEGPPVPGRPSPMGYWLTESADPSVGTHRVEIVSPRADPGGAPTEPAPAIPGRRTRPVRSVRIKSADGELNLVIGTTWARVAAGAATWQALAEPTLLAICQSWRFHAIDEELDRLTAIARGDLAHAAMPSPTTLRQRHRLAGQAEAVRTFLLDVPYFQGPLTDPHPFCSSEKSAETYETLAQKLSLEEWSEAIDERAEGVEITYEAVTEKLFEYRNFAWGAALEVLIVLILLLDVALRIRDYFVG